MGALAMLLGRETEARGFGEELAKIPGPLDEFRSPSGVLVDADTALRHIDVYKNVSLIADAMAMLPVRAMRNVAYSAPSGPKIFAEKLPRQPLIFTDPNPQSMIPEFGTKHCQMVSLLLDGNTYNEIGSVDAQGFPASMMPIDPKRIREVRMTRGVVEYVMHDGAVLGSYRNGGTMAHWPGFIEPGKLQGLSPIAAGMKGIGLGMAAETFGGRWFGDGAHPSGYLSTDREVSKTYADRVSKTWVRKYSGLSREPAFLYGGLKWNPIQINPEESQFIETRQLQAAQIAGLFRVPPHLVGDTSKATSWGTGIEEMGIGFVVFTLGPWIARMEQAASFLLPRGQFAKVTVDALLRGKVKDRMAAYAVGRQWGWLSVNDIRMLEDLPPIPDGDTYLQPLNMVDASEALALMLAGRDNDTQNQGDDDDE